MLLPVIDIKDNGLYNSNPEGPKLKVVGTGYIEDNYLNVMSETKSFITEGNIGYLTDITRDQDFTLEMVATDLFVSNQVFSIGTYLSEDHATLLVTKNDNSFILRTYNASTSGSVQSARYYFPIGMEVRTVQAVKLGDSISLYANAELIGTYDIPDEINIGGTVTLLNLYNGEDMVTTHSAEYETIRLSPDVSLSPDMFVSPSDATSADVELSTVAVDVLTADSLVTKLVSSISNFKDYIVVRYSDGSLESFSRPQGKDVANYIKDIYKTAELDMYVVLNDDTEILVGKAPPTKETVYGTQLVGTGYKSGESMLPFRASGNLFYVEDGVFKCRKLTQVALNYQLRVKYSLNFNYNKWSSLRVTDDGWGVLDVLATYTVKSPVEITGGKVLLTPGEYYCDGYVLMRPSDSTVLCLMDQDDNVLMKSGNVGTGPRNTTGNHNCRILGKFIVSDPLEISVGFRSTDTNLQSPDSELNGKIVAINIFKVA